jgi:hypothetical protein
MMTRNARIRLAASLALLLTAATLGVVGSAHATAGNTVLEWNAHAATALFNAPTATVRGAGQAPTVGSLHMAMVQGAVYDAVNSIDGGYEPYLETVPSASSGASMDAAAATAAHNVLVAVIPVLPISVTPPLTVDIVRTAIIDRLNTLYADSLTGISEPAKTDGITAGAAAATAMLTDRLNDGRFVPFSFTEGTGVGDWRPTAVPPAVLTDPFAWVGNVRPFVLKSPSQFRTDGPNAVNSDQYTVEFNEVKALGGDGVLTASARTPAQTALANFYTPNPVEMWNRTFRGIAVDQGLTMVEHARLFATLNLAGADALINCWNDKEFWHFWRPVTAIHLAATDGNPDTLEDTGWKPLFPTPPYPDHPSGYNCLTSSMMNAARGFFGTDKISFTVTNSPAIGATRSYRRFHDVVKDVIDARIYLGIHFRTPDVQGAVLGKKVAFYLNKNFLQPVDTG